MFDRRFVLAGLSLVAASPAWGAVAPAGLKFGAAQPFGLESLRDAARKAALKPFNAMPSPAQAVIQGIDFDRVQKIRFRMQDALRDGTGAGDAVAFFHLNKINPQPVRIFAVAPGGASAREILYSSNYFDYGASGLDPRPLAKLGFAGFRVLNGMGPTDWLAFQGASYFRSSGQDGQYGASARGIAINTGLATPEEFPRFTQFWLARNGETIRIYALLEGPSVTGVYQFDATKNGAVVMDVHCELFVRAGIGRIERLGIAPLTSMYWYGENERRKAVDWRPEIHDSDGLALWTGKGERIWRPLINPPALQTSSFTDVDPKGFGLMQRDRAFDDYQDDGAFYDKRPGIWVEPKGAWGAGQVQLVEIPTDDEVHDNIVAYWHPAAPVKSGDALSFDYRLYWQDAVPGYPTSLARVVATRIGRGGAAGESPPPANKCKFVVDFEGGALEQLQQRYDLTPVVTLSRGTAENAYVIKVVGTDRWRALFDIAIDASTPVDLRCYLKLGDKTLSETWIYRYFP